MRSSMMRLACLLFVASFAFATAAGAQVFGGIEGSWIVRITKADKGAARLEFGTPAAGVFSVTGRGFTRGTGDFFVVAPDQTLQRDSDGRISGTLALESDEKLPVPVGTLLLETGKVAGNFEKFSINGTITVGVLPPAAVKLKGTRVAATLPVLTGRSTAAKVAGGGAKSKFYDIAVTEDEAGFPIFEYEGLGPISVDGGELADVPMAGRFLLDDKQRLYGTFGSAVLGDGVVEGKLSRKTRASGISDPRLKLKAQAGVRKVRVNATLDRAVQPVIGVSPPAGADFGAVQLLGSAEQVFTVRNNGAGTLDGVARLEPGSDVDFRLLDAGGAQVEEVPYMVLAETSTSVRVRFTPSASGPRAGVLTFTGGGGATRSLAGIGSDLTVIPGGTFEFDDTEVGMTADLAFVVANAGATTLTGEATLTAGSPDFALREGGEDVTTIAYTLAPGATADLTVRFVPSEVGDFTGSISFSGGTGATRVLTGTAIAAP